MSCLDELAQFLALEELAQCLAPDRLEHFALDELARSDAP
jgi:hypothetical protein